MRNGTYTLNNSGHRWVVYENGKKPTFYVLDEQGNYHERTAIFFESFGQHAAYYFSYKGFKCSALAEWCEEHNGRAVVKESAISWPKSRLNPRRLLPEVVTDMRKLYLRALGKSWRKGISSEKFSYWSGMARKFDEQLKQYCRENNIDFTLVQQL